MSYSPINNAHSIVETVFFIQFSPAFDSSAIRKLISIKEELKEDFPVSRLLNKRTLHFAIDDKSAPSFKNEAEAESVGIELQKTRADGSVEWMLRTKEDSIAVHCLEYTKWNEVWQRAENWLIKAFEHIDGSGSFISSIGLRYVDRFLYEDDPEKSDLTELFNKDTPHLVKTAFTHGPLWHCNSGWFESSDELRWLNQLNLNADFANIKGNKTLRITVDHNAIAIVEQNTNQITKLGFIMNQLHFTNKRLLIELLTEQMTKRMNLNLPI